MMIVPVMIIDKSLRFQAWPYGLLVYGLLVQDVKGNADKTGNDFREIDLKFCYTIFSKVAGSFLPDSSLVVGPGRLGGRLILLHSLFVHPNISRQQTKLHTWANLNHPFALLADGFRSLGSSLFYLVAVRSRARKKKVL